MLSQSYKTPGVYIREMSAAPEREMRTGIPLFIGFSADGLEHGPQEVSRWEEFRATFGSPLPDRYLAYAVRGFFANGGTLCSVCSMDRGLPVAQALDRLLARLSDQELAKGVDLVCMPDIQMFPAQSPVLQQKILDFCRTGSRENGRYLFALLDSLMGAGVDEVLAQRRSLTGDDGALYYPWIRVQDGPVTSGGCIPPCGHIAGVYARSDQMYGVHKAPANEIIEEAIDLETVLGEQQQGFLNPENVNCLRSFPGRGIRIWGARTVSRDPSWLYVNVRRLFLSICRSIEGRMANMLFEPNDPALWMRITRELGGYLAELHRRGAFRADKAEEAYFVKCDRETNSDELRDEGKVVVEIGLAMAVPGEFILVRIVQSDGGVSVLPQAGPSPFPSPPPIASHGDAPAGIGIVGIADNPPGRDLPGEYALLRNQGGYAVDMTGWMLSDLAGHRYLFPRYTLHPGAEVKVWTKEGEDTLSDLYWGHRAPLWNNTGDTAYLHDSHNNRVACFVYSKKR